ncbi:MAG: NUDIX hydrolase [Colwellia sp.]|nr:NUDIX hydrolase [Colwellia sp.]
MAKAYIIVHDGADVLIGVGGRSGKKRNIRGGYHLPGGTINYGETPEAAAIREFSEETGLDAQQLVIERNNITANDAPGVTFIVARVQSVDDLVASFIRPAVNNAYDEPFEGVISLRSEDSWDNDNFSAQYYTDWFLYGLYAAKDLIAPQ